MYIGIDLGTSNSSVAGIVDKKAEIFRPTDGGEVLPSCIYIDKRGHRLYGRRAHDQAMIAPDNVALGFKRLMGTSTKIEVKGANVTLSPEECSADIIRQLLAQAAQASGGQSVTGAIITVPAAFNQMQFEATLRAAREAGLENVDLLQEPVAAALAAMAGAKRSGQFLIYDLGGGTFDVALASSLNGEVSIVAQQGINMLGGRDFDRMIVNEIVRPWLLENFDLPENFQRDKQYSRLVRIAMLAAEKAKIDLSVLEETTIFTSDDEIRLLDQAETEIFLDAPITRKQFENLIREPIGQTIDMIRQIMTENNYTHEDIDRIVFIGGPSRIPLVRQMVSDELGIAADLKTDPMTAVALGAAYYCESRLWGAEAMAQMNNGAKSAQATDGANMAGGGGAVGLFDTENDFEDDEFEDDVPQQDPAEEHSAGKFVDGVGLSAPKKMEAISQSNADAAVKYIYTARLPDEKTVVSIEVDGAVVHGRQVSLSGENWTSGPQPLKNGLKITVPLAKTGENIFEADLLDENGQKIPNGTQKLTISRLVATAKVIPAAQTIAVKVLEKTDARENVLVPLVTKGAMLPASGKAEFKAGRDLKPRGRGAISFELFQVEYPERIDLNLCVGLFRIESGDLPQGKSISAGDPIVFDWRMSDGGILQASVRLPKSDLDLRVPRFYAPQAGQISFDGPKGHAFANAVLARSEEEWGDLSAALGPDGGPELQLLRTRLDEQKESLEDAGHDAETIRRIVEETRFIRQDIARQYKKHFVPVLQRRLGKMTAIFNRVARAEATKTESAQFDECARKIQNVIDEKAEHAYEESTLLFGDMRNVFFSVAWRNQNYVVTWFKRLMQEPHLFPNEDEFNGMVKEGEKFQTDGDKAGLRDVVSRMLEARIALGASDIAGEPATIVKG